MEKIWLRSYPTGVPAEIDPARYPSLVHLMEESFERNLGRQAYVCLDTFLNYGELDHYSRSLAAWLQGRGLARGARVAVMMPNILPYPVAVAGILRAGYTVVNVNPLYTPRELRHQLADSGAEAIIVLENFAATLQQVLDETEVKHVLVATLGDMHGRIKGAVLKFAARQVKRMVPPFSLPGAVLFEKALKDGESMPFERIVPDAEDIAFLQYTGGTTGVSKGAILTHRNLVANALQNDAWAAPALMKDGENEQLVTVCALPLYHVMALTGCLLMGIHWGAMTILVPNPRDIPGLIKVLGKHRFHFFPAVNTLFNALLNHPAFARLDFSSLRVSLGGGMAMQKAVSERWHHVTGCPVLEGYGLSETSPVASLNPHDLTAFSGTIGLPLPSTEIAILDDAGQPLPVGASGEVGIRGPQVMRGYWNMPEETAKVMTRDGYFRSGDIGVMDENGFVTLVDRKKDMILVSGFNVYPNEIEGVVAAHPGVLECACVGVPDEHAGEAVKLFVVPRDTSLTVEEVMRYCKEQFTGYKKPKYIEFREDLPKSNVGKILRRQLRDGPSPA
ncbi:long-chain-fatty-acid--CoA ligase [Paludibacterium paludis]|uniref:Long-chain-fatty-acid--CoA ligase n=1 Tax=Paludibacterium paludis TaxID=1225769 RepID=A0A918P551_9NEIS|nr:long-chain-fatty-acid--CoA ligase [Paludibacterium paludis]GGY20353.1 long-chain-fatty-acid--CoA ligase [Paludibacterium paludis]